LGDKSYFYVSNEQDMILKTASLADVTVIWDILQAAIAQRKEDGSTQWQDGYPNSKTVGDDFAKGYSYVLFENGVVVAYAAIIFGEEPTYNDIKGEWLSHSDYVVVHRVATAPEYKGKGMATLLFEKIEELSVAKGVFSIKVDTNYDNFPMLKILEKLGYTYCGEIEVRGTPRKAFEKLLK
jgi:GNAT superfamily N-acetyltransferase